MRVCFETLIEQKRLGIPSGLQREIRNTALRLPEVDRVGLRWSKKNYPNGYTSYGSLSELHRNFTVFDRLRSALDPEARSFSRKLGLKVSGHELVLTSLWVNLMPEGCYHAFHHHPRSVISGTYYVDVPRGSSPLRVEDPRAPLFMASPARKIQEDLVPRVGEIILFESWLRHEVPPNRVKGTRVSVSFNYELEKN
ncbi:MAG: hypothetical protein KGP28_11045 [Bdellovibrionales bacterium]|nr:hypothetical protein [Bdellovibrionales bacterium]